MMSLQAKLRRMILKTQGEISRGIFRAIYATASGNSSWRTSSASACSASISPWIFAFAASEPCGVVPTATGEKAIKHRQRGKKLPDGRRECSVPDHGKTFERQPLIESRLLINGFSASGDLSEP